MNQLQVHLLDGKAQFRPGEVVQGEVVWELAAPPNKLEVRLFWFTIGDVVREANAVERTLVNRPAAAGRQSFRFRLPAGPQSFHGSLVSLGWGVEALAYPGAFC